MNHTTQGAATNKRVRRRPLATTKTLRLTDELCGRIEAYREATGTREADALRTLLDAGLMAQGMSLYATPLGRFMHELVQGELDAWRAEQDRRADDLEDRVARVCSRGTRASLHTAALLGDVARATVPAWRDTPAEDIWRTYQAMGGAVQQGLPLADARRQAREAGHHDPS